MLPLITTKWNPHTFIVVNFISDSILVSLWFETFLLVLHFGVPF